MTPLDLFYWMVAFGAGLAAIIGAVIAVIVVVSRW
jgi:hypothetical protein